MNVRYVGPHREPLEIFHEGKTYIFEYGQAVDVPDDLAKGTAHKYREVDGTKFDPKNPQHVAFESDFIEVPGTSGLLAQNAEDAPVWEVVGKKEEG